MSYAPQEPQSFGSNPAARTNLPGIFLLIVGILNLLGAIYFIYSGFQGMKQAPALTREMEASSPEQKKKMEEAQKQMPFSMEQMFKGMGQAFIVVGVIAIIVSIITIMGGVKMRSLTGYGLAMTGSILAIIPCISPCCLVGAPIGIWALVVLMSSDVKSAFR